MPFVYRYRGGRFDAFELPVVREWPLALFVNGQELATMLCTPVKLEALVLGFLRFERIIEDLTDVVELDVDPEEGFAEVRLTREVPLPKRRILTSGCTGGLTFSLELREHQLPREDTSLDPACVFPMMHELYEKALLYRESRGIHAAGLSDGEKLLIVAEDVGRHNAVDKVQGEALLRQVSTPGKFLLSTGRISSEMLRKGARMGTPFILSRTSPTHLAIEGAKRLGITLIGYVRGDSFTVYSHPERIASTPKPLAVSPS